MDIPGEFTSLFGHLRQVSVLIWTPPQTPLHVWGKKWTLRRAGYSLADETGRDRPTGWVLIDLHGNLAYHSADKIKEKGHFSVILDLIEIRRDIHRHPETAFKEERTASVIQQHLKRLDLDSRRCAGTGVICDIQGKGPGPTIALRADIDALPITEATGLPFQSVNQGVMHACGHDSHVAILLGAAERLAATREQWPGTVRLIFQPAEEVVGGASKMVEDGALAGVRAIFGLHNDPTLPVGTAGVAAGPVMAASDRFAVTITGKGGHAAYPHQTTDPILAAAAVVVGLQTIASRIISPLEPVVVSVGQFHAGTTGNIIPDRAELRGTTRYFNLKVGEELPGLMETVIGQIAKGYRCRAEIKYDYLVKPVVNDASLTALVRSVCRQELGDGNVRDFDKVMGAEDFSVYQQIIPGCIFRLGSEGPFGLHHPQFNINEECLDIGAGLLAEVAKKALAELG